MKRVEEALPGTVSQPPAPSPRTQHRGKGVIAVWLILGLLVAILFVPLAIAPIDGDPALYSYIGWRVSQGDRLYLDVWDVKPPLFPLMYAAGFLVFGRQEWVGPLIEMLCIWFGAVGVFFLARRLGSAASSGRPEGGAQLFDQPSSIAGCIASIALLAALIGIRNAGMSMQAEIFALPFVIWPMVWAYREPVTFGRAMASGVLIACAALIKTPFVLFAVPWFFAAGFAGTVAPFLIGLIGPIGLMAIYIASIGAFDEARYTLLEFGPAFAGAHKRPSDAAVSSAAHMAGDLWLLPVLFGIGALTLLFDRRLGALLAGFVASLVVVFWQSSFWIYHWMVAQAFALVAAGVLIGGWLERRFIASAQGPTSPPPAPSPSSGTNHPRDGEGVQIGDRPKLKAPTSKLLLAVAGLAFLVLLMTPQQTFWLELAGLGWQRISGRLDDAAYTEQFPSAYGWPPLTQKTVRSLAAKVRASTGPKDTIWTPMAPPTIAFLAGRREAVRFAYSDGLFVDAPRRSDWRDEYMTAVGREKPELVILVRDFQGQDKQRLVGQIRGASQVLEEDYEIAEILQADGAQGPAIELLKRR